MKHKLVVDCLGSFEPGQDSSDAAGNGCDEPPSGSTSSTEGSWDSAGHPNRCRQIGIPCIFPHRLARALKLGQGNPDAQHAKGCCQPCLFQTRYYADPERPGEVGRIEMIDSILKPLLPAVSCSPEGTQHVPSPNALLAIATCPTAKATWPPTDRPLAQLRQLFGLGEPLRDFSLLQVGRDMGMSGSSGTPRMKRRYEKKNRVARRKGLFTEGAGAGAVGAAEAVPMPSPQCEL